MTKESRTTVNDPKAPRTRYDQTTGPNTSVTSGVSIGNKPEFETIYRRVARSPKQESK